LKTNSPKVDGRTAMGRKKRAETRARIIAAAFEILGDENGLFARIEDVVERAAVTRATFYNHFAGIAELRDAVAQEMTHDFLVAVVQSVNKLPDPRERCTAAIRFYLHRARNDHRWAWSMINVSASGKIFGAETYRQAEQTVRDGVELGALPIPSVELGRDILLGSSLAAMGSMLKDDLPDNYPEAVAGYILVALGVPIATAHETAHLPLPKLHAS
jgi:AcrR family transcriptional regulator